MKTDRYAPFAVFALIVLVIIIAQISTLNLSPLPEFTSVPSTGIPLSTATATREPISTPTLTPTIIPTPTPQTVFLFDRDNFPSCFTSRGYDGMRAYSLAGKLHLAISSAGYDYQICDEQVFSNFIYETDVTLVDTAPADAEFGLIARYNMRDDGSVQYYELTVRDSSASLYYFDGSASDPWTKLLDAVPVPVFNPIGSNHIKLIATGDTLAFFINDVFIGQAQDQNLASGYVGVSLSNYGSTSYNQHVVYANMRVHDLTWSAILYEDSKFSDGGCFGERRGDMFDTSAQNGQYHINLAADNNLLVPCEGAGLDVLTDFVLEADIVQETAGKSGLAFRTNTDIGAMYAFLMDPAGYVSLAFYPNSVDAPVILTDLASVTGISAIGETNHLKVIAVGDTILIYINGSLVSQVQDAGASSGGIAFLAQASEADFQIIFDNVKITSLVAP
jgi:hypothetical protein